MINTSMYSRIDIYMSNDVYIFSIQQWRMYLSISIYIIISYVSCVYQYTNICMDQLHQLILHDFYINSDRCYQVVYNILINRKIVYD